MKKITLLFLLFASFQLITGQITDVEGKTYPTINIGNQEWMQENLSVSRFRNGDIIMHAKTTEEWESAFADGIPAWCYYNNDSVNGIKYGKLYNWFAVNDSRGIAPQGWRVPSKQDWLNLELFSGNDSTSNIKLKSNNLWNEFEEFRYDSLANLDVPSGNVISGNGTNESNFNGLPAGVREFYGSYCLIGTITVWWSTTVDVNFGIYVKQLTNTNQEHNLNIQNSGYSIRCIKN